MYTSLQGEGSHMGLPCFFIRTAGCDLRCVWCDTPDALTATSGTWQSIDEIIERIPPHMRLVQITGGEPLLWRDAVSNLAVRLAAKGIEVLLETGGHKSLSGLPESIHIVMDIKLKGSGESDHSFEENLPYLKAGDEIKFVIQNRSDFEEAVDWIRQYGLTEKCGVLLSPVWGSVAFDALASWVIETALPVRMQIQMHKVIWGATAKGV
ncbi:MAG: radical SAM protein [Spirochaetia bacterium]|nr:radical SAM protein [Spirochaetia bacterium]